MIDISNNYIYSNIFSEYCAMLNDFYPYYLRCFCHSCNMLNLLSIITSNI